MGFGFSIFIKLCPLSMCVLLLAPCAHGEFEYQGSLAGFVSQMPGQKQTDVTRQKGGLEGQLQTRTTFTKNYAFQFRSWLQGDGFNKSDKEKFQFEAQDFYFEYRRSARRIKVGVHSPAWEGTDLINPMDFVIAKNYTDPFQIKNRGSAGLFYSDQIKSFSWDFVYIPWQTKSVLPGEKSPWYPRQIYLPVDTEGVELRLPSPVQYRIQDDEVSRGALIHNVGLRLQWRGDALDVSLAGFEGAASQPLLLPTVRGTIIPPNTVELVNPIEIQPLYYRHRVGAAALVFNHGTWIIRLAAQHAQPLGTDSRLPSWSEYGVLGVEKTLEWKDQGITLLAQIVGARRPQSESLSALSSLLEKAAMLGVRFPFRENWVWNTAFFQEQKNKSHFFHTDVTWTLTDHWRFEIAGDVLSGPPESALGTYNENDRVTFKTIYAF